MKLAWVDTNGLKDFLVFIKGSETVHLLFWCFRQETELVDVHKHFDQLSKYDRVSIVCRGRCIPLLYEVNKSFDKKQFLELVANYLEG